MIHVKDTDDDKLYQWDQNQFVVLTGDDAWATEVHFAHYCSDATALIVEVQTDDYGVKCAPIPNSFLVKSKDICAWTWVDDQTISGKRFKVTERNRPGDFVYQPTEVLNYEHLKQWVMDEFQKFSVANATDYEALKNKPKINSVELVGDKAFSELGMDSITDEDIDGLFTD